MVTRKLSIIILLIFLNFACFAKNTLDAFTGKNSKPEPFVFLIQKNSNQDYNFNWIITPGNQLYKHSLQIVDAKTHEDLIKNHKLPDGIKIKDEYLGEYSIYLQNLEFNLKLKAENLNHGIYVSYQGCSNAGLCYAPITKTITFNKNNNSIIDVSDSILPSQFGKHSILSKNTNQDFNFFKIYNNSSKIYELVKHSNIVFIILVFFVFGILLSFTPCVLPMVPIIINIISGKKLSTRKAVILTCSYILGMAISYAITGVIAGIIGNSIQAQLQQPFIIILLTCFILYLAILQFEVFKVPNFINFNSYLHKASSRLTGGSILAVFLMGAVATLIISPCITPPLVGALTYIGKTGNPIIGAIALFSLGLGMGVLLLTVAIFENKFLPKSKHLMQNIKNISGILLIALAIWLLARILPPTIEQVIWAALAIFIAVFLRAFENLPAKASKTKIIKKGLGLFCAMLGVILMVSAIINNKQNYILANGNINNNITTDSNTLIKNQSELNIYLKNNKPIILYVHATWCTSCQKISHDIFQSKTIKQALRDFIILELDVTDFNQDNLTVIEQYNLFGPPAILFFNSAGRELTDLRVNGEIDYNEFTNIIRKVN